ncbi:MAG: ankyrin repeat domain-containing protein, partial [Planctomycetota bacterium]
MKRHHISILICVLIVFSCLGVDVAWSQAKKDLNQAAVDGDLDRVKSLVSGGADVNVKNRMGMTPLVVAAMNDRTAVCEFLVANGADLNAKDGRSQTALYFAVDKGNKELVEMLVKKGADVNITTGRGENAFSLAKKNQNTEIVDLLAKNGATDPVISDVYGDEYYGGEGIRPGGPGGR